MKYLLFMFTVLILVNCVGCAPLRDTAGNVSGGIGEVSDEIGAEHQIGEGDNPIVISPMEDKKVKMAF